MAALDGRPQAPTLNFFTPRKHTDVLKNAPTLDRTAEGGTGADFDWSDRSRERHLYDYCGVGHYWSV